MTPPAVSVIVPVRDRGALLRACLDALHAQTFGDHEVIVVDDGSRDGSGAEAEERGHPVRVLRTPGVGAVAARRVGVRASSAPILAFTDSDCVPDPRWLEVGVSAIRSGSAIASGPTWPARQALPLERTLASDGKDGLYPTCNVFYDRRAYDDAGGFDAGAGERLGFRPGSTLRGTGFGEDTLLAWRVRRAGGRAELCPDAVVYHHVFPADVTETFRRAWGAGAFPALVREVPELRDTFLLNGRFLGWRGRLGLYAAALLLVAGRRAPAALSVSAWALARGRRALAAEVSRRRALWSVPTEVAADAVTAAALASGSIRRHSLVL